MITNWKDGKVTEIPDIIHCCRLCGMREANNVYDLCSYCLSLSSKYGPETGPGVFYRIPVPPKDEVGSGRRRFLVSMAVAFIASLIFIWVVLHGF